MKWNGWGMIISLTLLFYVLTKFIFNIFATIKLSFDKWSLIDIVCAFSNIICFFVLRMMRPEDVISYKSSKIKYNMIMIVLVVSTWIRLIFILFVT